MAPRVRIGTILEIPTPRGKAYAQVTHKHVRYGELIAVHEGLHERAPTRVETVVVAPVRFVTFFAVPASVRDGFMHVVGHAPVPEGQRPFPLFRTLGLTDRASPDKEPWWLWDGEKEWRVGELTEQQRRLPLRMIPGQPLLLERILSGWRPALDPR